MSRSAAQLETVDFLLSKAARLDKALRSLPKADLKTLHTSSHKRGRKVLRSLSFPAKAKEESDIEQQLDQLDVLKVSAAVSSAKKMPPLSEALTVGPDAVMVRAQALEARQGLAEDLCTEAIARTGANLDWVDLDELKEGMKEMPMSKRMSKTMSKTSIKERKASKEFVKRWPSVEEFSAAYYVPEHLQVPPRAPSTPSEPSASPKRPTIAGIEDSQAIGVYADLLPALLKSAERPSHLSEPAIARPASGKGKPSAQQSMFQAGQVYREACRQFGLVPYDPPPIFGETVEVVGASLDETKHCYALAAAVRCSAPKTLKVEDCMMPDMGTAAVVEAAFAGQLQVMSLSGLAMSYRSALALFTGLRSKTGRSLQTLSLAACGLGADIDEDELPERAMAAYTRSRQALGKERPDFAQLGDVAGLMSAHLLDARLKEREEAMAKFAREEQEDAEEEKVEPIPILLPVLVQLSRCSLRSLNLSQTWLSPSCVTALAKCLPATQLEVLCLNECGLTDSSLEDLALEGILRSRFLLELSLRRNQLNGSAGAINTLFQAVKLHARLAHLDLAENLMYPECIPELCDLLARSVSLACLHLLGCEDSLVEDTMKIQAACYRWAAENCGQEVIPEPAQGEEHSELIISRALHLERFKDWQVVTPPPKPTKQQDGAPEPAKKLPPGCWIAEAQRNPDFQIPEGPPEAGVTEEEIGDWSQGPARLQALADCYEEDIQNIYLNDVCHIDDEEAVKEGLRSRYHTYYECYALFAGRSQWPFVRYVDMYSVFDEAGVVDRSGRRNGLQMQDVHVMVTQTLANASNTRATEGVVTRPQFFEVMLRAALAYASLAHAHETEAEANAASAANAAGLAIVRFADEVVAGRVLQVPVGPFPRGLALRPGDYSDALASHAKTLREAWERFGYSEVAFQRLAQLVRLCDRSFTSKHVASIYALARQPQPNFQAGVRSLQFPEFCEAVGRLAMVRSRSSRMPACCPREDGSMRERQWPPQPQAGRAVREKALAARLNDLVKRLSERMKPSVRSGVSFL